MANTVVTISKEVRIERMKIKYLNTKFVADFLWRIVRLVIIAGISFMILYPFIIKGFNAVKTIDDFTDPTVRFISRNPTLDNIKVCIQKLRFQVAGVNSLELALLTSVLQVAVCTLIGYGFGRFKFRGRNIVFGAVIFTLLVPPQTIMIPMFMQFRFFSLFGFGGINVLDSFTPFIILSATGLGLKNGLYIYMMRQFFRGMPKELEEAAYIDGSGLFKTFLTIMVPAAVPMLITIFLFSFSWQWTDIFYSALFFNKLPVLTRTIADVASITQQDPIMFANLRNTASMLVIIPLMLVYIGAQRFFIQGIERSGIVG